MKASDIPAKVKIGCGCLSTRSDKMLIGGGTTCVHGAHWDTRAGAGQFGIEVPPAKDSLKVSAGQWYAAYLAMKPHFEVALPTAEDRLSDYNAAAISPSSFDATATE